MTKQKNNSKYLGHDYSNKSTDSARLIQKELNSLAGTNDARKLISVLRHKEGWQIEDCRLSNGCKLYWLAGKGGSDE